MDFVSFPQANVNLAENQPEYQTVPVYLESREMDMPGGKSPVAWSMTAVMEFTDEEIEEIVKTKRLYYRQMLFGRQFQPIFISTKDPFIPENKEHWPQE